MMSQSVLIMGNVRENANVCSNYVLANNPEQGK